MDRYIDEPAGGKDDAMAELRYICDLLGDRDARMFNLETSRGSDLLRCKEYFRFQGMEAV